MSGRLREAQETQLPTEGTPTTSCLKVLESPHLEVQDRGLVREKLKEGDSGRVCVTWGISVSADKRELWSRA